MNKKIKTYRVVFSSYNDDDPEFIKREFCLLNASGYPYNYSGKLSNYGNYTIQDVNNNEVFPIYRGELRRFNNKNYDPKYKNK